MTRTNKSLLGSLMMLGVSALLSLVAAEFLVRAVRPQPRLVIAPGGFYTTDPPGRYRLSPGYRGRIYNRAEYDNEIRINSHGLRGEEVDRKTRQTMRLLAIGDSFVFGVGVEDTQTAIALTAKRLTESGAPAEALNAGIPAFGVPDAVSWLSRHGVELEPDVVILAIFLGNDLVDASPGREDILIVNGLLVPSQSSRGIKAWLHRHSHLFVLLKSLLEQPGLLPVREKLSLGEPWKVRVLREEFGVYHKSAPRDLKLAIEATDRALGDLVALSSEHGFAVGAVLIPSEIQVDPERWRAGLASLGLDAGEYDPEMPSRIFQELLDQHSIPALDLGPVFSAGLNEGRELYYRLDRHWTVEGNALAAEEMLSFLGQRPWQEKSPPDAASMATSGEPRE